jgi:hypothetical protein
LISNYLNIIPSNKEFSDASSELLESITYTSPVKAQIILGKQDDFKHLGDITSLLKLTNEQKIIFKNNFKLILKLYEKDYLKDYSKNDSLKILKDDKKLKKLLIIKNRKNINKKFN